MAFTKMGGLAFLKNKTEPTETIEEPNQVDGNALALMRDEDDKAFLERVKTNLDGLEIIRQAKLKVYKFRKKIAIPLAVILTPPCAFIDFWLLMRTSGSDDDGGAGLTIFMLGGLYMWATKPKRDYAKSYKKSILPRLAHALGLNYSLGKKISIHEMKPSKIVPKHDKYESEDYFEGSYKNVALKFSEINLKQKRRGKNRTYYVSVFKGLAILLEMDRKKFNGHTIVQQNRSKFIEWFKEKSSGMQRADLVDPEFEKLFDAYTTDQVEARYLIDPAIIEELKGIKSEYDGKKMLVAYYDSKVLVMIATNTNHFEPANIYVKATDPISILNMKQEIIQILSLIDKLDLYDPYALMAEKEQEKSESIPNETPPQEETNNKNDDDDGIPDGQVML